MRCRKGQHTLTTTKQFMKNYEDNSDMKFN